MLPAMATSSPPAMKNSGKRSSFTMTSYTTVKPPEEVPGGWRLKPASGRLAGAIVIGCIALFWNGITWTILIGSWRSEHGFVAGGITLFLSIFALLGALMVWAFIHQLLKALFTPRLELTLSTPRLVIGGATELRWSITKAKQHLTDLKISLQLREECQYRRGTDTITDLHEAHAITAYEHGEPDADGRCALLVPTNLPPSFANKSNQLVWSIRLSGSVPGLPDVDDEYPITVEPPQIVTASITPAPLPAGTVLPEDSPLLTLTNGGTGVVPGAPIAGVVRAPGKAVTLRLRWATSGKGDQQGETVVTTLLAADAAGFILILPSLPPLWQGTVLSFTWHLEAEVDGASLTALTLTP